MTPFTSAYNAGLLSSDRFNTGLDAPVLQPSIIPDMPAPVVSTHIQSRFSGFDIYALGLHAASPLRGNFGLGLSIMSIGNSDFKSTEILLNVGKKLSPEWGIGISQRLRRSRIGDEARPWTGTSSTAASFDTGNWGLAVHLTGLIPWNQAQNVEPFSAHLASYMEWETRTSMYMVLAYSNREITPVLGIRQSILKSVELFGAFQLYPARYGLGFTLPLTRDIQTICSTQYHPVLGWSPSIGIRWMIRKAEG